MTSVVEFKVLHPFILMPGEREEITGTIFADGIEPQITSVGLQNWSGYYQVDERTYKYIFGEYIDLYSDNMKVESIDIIATPFNSEYQFEVAYPSFAMTDRLGDSIPFELRWWIGHDGTFSENIETIGEITYAQQLLPSPDIFSLNTFSPEQVLRLGEYIQDTTSDIALKSFSFDDNGATVNFEFNYIPTSYSREANHNNTTTSYFSHLNASLFKSEVTSVLSTTLEPPQTMSFEDSYASFVNSYPTQYWLAQVNYQREYLLDKMYLIIDMSDATYRFDRSNGTFAKFSNNQKEKFALGGLIEFAEEFDWQIQVAQTAYSDYFKLDQSRLLFWEYSSSEAKIFDETSQELITFSVHEKGYEVNLADAVITNDDTLLLLVSGSDGVGGNHYFAKLYDLTGTHLKTVLLSNNGYDGSLVKLENDQYGIIIDTTFQTISSDLSSFSLPIDLNIDAWSTTRTQQFSEQLIKVAKFNGSDNWFNDLLWMNSQLDDGDNTYFSTKVNDTIMSFEGDDVVFAGVGDDIVSGGAGNDKLYGNEGNDTLKDGIGSDVILGGSGDDSIALVSETRFAGPNVAYNVKTKVQESLFGKSKYTASINGETGIDTIILMDSENGDAFFLHDAYSDLHESVSTTADDKGMQTAARVISVETILAGDGDDIIDLTSDTFDMGGTNITLKGEAGNDVLWAAEGNDTLDGGLGDDTLFGADGNDTLTGGDGADVFEFVNSALAQTDTITDYTSDDTLKFYLGDGDSQITEADYQNGTLTWGNLTIAFEDRLGTGTDEDVNDLSIVYI